VAEMLVVESIGQHEKQKRQHRAWPPLTGANFGVMHLSGRYSNPPEALETALAAFSEGDRRSRRREENPLVPGPRRLGNCELQSAVIGVLEVADRPLRVGEVRRPLNDGYASQCLHPR